MKKILVATDFTEYAEYAVSSAASIAEQSGAQLILLHVVNRPLTSNDESYENYHNIPRGETIVMNIENKLNAIVKQHNIKNAKIRFELVEQHTWYRGHHESGIEETLEKVFFGI